MLFGANSTELITRLALDYSELGLLGSMLSLGLGVGIVAAGPISDRLPRRPLYAGACLVVLTATTTLGSWTDYTALLAHTAAIGFGAGFYETVLNALIVEEFGERAPKRLILIHSAATLAASATPIAFELAREVAPLTWYDTFRVVGWLHAGLILAAVFVPMRPSSRASITESNRPAPVVEPQLGSDSPTPRGRNDRLALAAVCTATFAYVGVESALTLFVADHAVSDLGLGAARAARTISAFWGGLLVGRLAIGLAPRPAGAGSTALLAALAAVLVGLFGLGFIGSPELAMGGVGFCLGGVFPIMIGFAGIALPSATGTAVGLAGGLGSLGGFVVPWLTGRIAEGVAGGSLSIALASLAGWLSLLVLAALFVRRRHSAS